MNNQKISREQAEQIVHMATFANKLVTLGKKAQAFMLPRCILTALLVATSKYARGINVSHSEVIAEMRDLAEPDEQPHTVN